LHILIDTLSIYFPSILVCDSMRVQRTSERVGAGWSKVRLRREDSESQGLKQHEGELLCITRMKISHELDNGRCSF
jgi:hypothetical protein